MLRCCGLSALRRPYMSLPAWLERAGGRYGGLRGAREGCDPHAAARIIENPRRSLKIMAFQGFLDAFACVLGLESHRALRFFSSY